VLEARIVAARGEPPGLARDCKVANLEARLDVCRDLAKLWHQYRELEAQYGGPIKLDPYWRQMLEDALDDLDEQPKPN
jgi:hypothetical protein